MDWNEPPDDGWTTDDLPPGRYELVDGVVPVGPAPGRAHQTVVRLLGAKLQAVCPSEYEVIQGAELRFSERRTFRPDVQGTFAGVGRRRDSWLPPREVVTAGEVVAPTSKVM